MKPKELNQYTDQEVKEFIQQHQTVVNWAQSLGLSPASLRRYLLNRGIKNTPDVCDADKLLGQKTNDELKQMFLQAGSYTELAQQWELPKHKLTTYFQKRQVKVLAEVKLKREPRHQILGKVNVLETQRRITEGTTQENLAQEWQCTLFTVQKVCEELGIKFPHRGSANIRDNNPEWWKKSVATRQAEGTYQKPHPGNRKVLNISEKDLQELVQYRGVLRAAKFLNCSQSTVRERCKELKIKLSSGPHPEITQTPEFSSRMRRQALNNLSSGKFLMKNTSIELLLQGALIAKGQPFQLHPELINLTVPDLFIGPKIAIYADGCYWHGCPTCSIKDADKHNVNKNHDKFVNKQLTAAGYKVLRFWEHEITEDLPGCISKIEQAIKDDKK